MRKMYYDIEESGKRLKKLRKGKNMTQKELAEVLDIHVKTISKAERGVNGMSIDNLLKVSQFFHVTIDYLVKGDKEENTNYSLQKLLERLSEEQEKIACQIIENVLIFPKM